MWIFTPDGFFSIVDKHDNSEGNLCIRARASGDLDNLRKRIPELGPTILGGGTDYPARAYVTREDAATWLVEQIENMDYSNFKSEVAHVQGPTRAHVYGGVWTQMLKVEREG